MSHPSPEDSHEHSPTPPGEEIAESARKRDGRINPATFEVRLRRWALLLLIVVPGLWFLFEQLP